jgi:phosphoenolpyruvate synthase/pyruvate phosphate dikinase
VVSVFRDNLWTSFLPKTILKETLQEGVELFGSKELFEEYTNEFSNYKKDSGDFFQKVTSKNNISKTELTVFFQLISKLWHYYKKTEFFYVDDAYKVSKRNGIISKNLKHLEEIKNSGREYLNKLIFGSSSYLSQAVEILGKRFKISKDDLFYYSKEEIIGLYDRKIVENSILNGRRKSYVFLIRDSKLITFQGEKSEEYIQNFLIEHKANEGIRGTTANPGKITGRAKVIFYGADTFDKVSHMIADMKDGDILVTETTSPEIMLACKKASAILTNQGGLLSHAAIVSRELNIPCIVGLEDITHVVNDGDLLEVDADNGSVKILEKKL